MLDHCYDLVDYVSLHTYYDPLVTDLPTFLGSSADLDHMITAIVATADHVGARLKSKHRLRLSVDEWNVWKQASFPGQDALRYDGDPTLIEDVYDVADAVVVGSLLITLLRHADRVGIACHAQLVNVIAPILTRAGGPAWRQTIFHPFAQAARWASGDVLMVQPVVDSYETEKYGEVPLLDATATYDEESGDVTVLCVNRSVDSPLELRADLRGLAKHGAPSLVTAEVLADDDITASNSEEQPDRVSPRQLKDVTLDDGQLHAMLPPVSWTVLRLSTTDR
jgi:alpha-N-arabinofuranosidase